MLAIKWQKNYMYSYQLNVLYICRCIFSVSNTGILKVEPKTFWLTTSPDTLPLSYRRCVGAQVIIFFCQVHPKKINLFYRQFQSYLV